MADNLSLSPVCSSFLLATVELMSDTNLFYDPRLIKDNINQPDPVQGLQRRAAVHSHVTAKNQVRSEVQYTVFFSLQQLDC